MASAGVTVLYPKVARTVFTYCSAVSRQMRPRGMRPPVHATGDGGCVVVPPEGPPSFPGAPEGPAEPIVAPVASGKSSPAPIDPVQPNRAAAMMAIPVAPVVPEIVR